MTAVSVAVIAAKQAETLELDFMMHVSDTDSSLRDAAVRCGARRPAKSHGSRCFFLVHRHRYAFHF
jgi:hypothetical protein